MRYLSLVVFLLCSGCAVSCEIAEPTQSEPSNEQLAKALQQHAGALTNVLERLQALEGPGDDS